MSANPVAQILKFLRDNDPRVEGKKARETLASSPGRLAIYVEWHEAYAAEALLLSEAGLHGLVLGDQGRREVATSRAYACCSSSQDQDVLTLAVETFSGDVTMRGTARDLLRFADEKQVREVCRVTHEWETKWIAAAKVGPS